MNRRRRGGYTVQPIRGGFVFYHSHLVFRLFFVDFTMLWAYPVQKSSHSVGSKLYSKSAKMEVSELLTDQDRKLLYICSR